MEFRVLGPLEVEDGGSVLPLGGPKQRAVLAYLLLHGSQVVATDRLIDQLWGERPPETVRTVLQGCVSNLRKVLGAEVIQTRASGYALELDPEALDLHRFERLLTEARAAAESSDHETAASRLREALALWRGPALADFLYESFAQAPVARLEELRLTATEDLVDAELACGRHAAVVSELESLIADHPLRERLRGQLMLGLYRSGRQADALGAYQEARRVLVDELGIEPSETLQELERAILRHDPALEPRPVAVQAAGAAAGPAPPPERSILVLAQDEGGLAAAVDLAHPLARRPPREVIAALLVAPGAELGPATRALRECRAKLDAESVTSRVVTFTSAERGTDAVRLATEENVDLLVLTVERAVLDGGPFPEELATVLLGAPCDVGVLIPAAEGSSQSAERSIVIPFGGAEHEWAAAEVGAWIAASRGAELRLLGAGADRESGRRDASRLLATASLALQRVSGVVPEPVVVAPGPDAVVAAAADAGLVVLGLSDRWHQEGLGTGRLAVAAGAPCATLLVRGGIRPGGLAPRESLTRYTWSLATGAG